MSRVPVAYGSSAQKDVVSSSLSFITKSKIVLGCLRTLDHDSLAQIEPETMSFTQTFAHMSKVALIITYSLSSCLSLHELARCCEASLELGASIFGTGHTFFTGRK